MKKSIVAVAVLLGTSSAFAQDLENKMGESYLPQAEDWAIGIDASPFLKYVGNLIGNGQNGNDGPSWNTITQNMQIYGKYFAADDMAYRASIRIGYTSDSEKMMVDDRSDNFVATPAPNPWPDASAEVENKWSDQTMNIGLSVGLEKRRGFGRLQGYYGAEFGVNFASTSQKYEYGNALVSHVLANDLGNVDVTAADAMNGGANIVNENDGAGVNRDGRVLSNKDGLEFSIGLRGFIGVEYFIMPRIALGAEFGWGLMFVNQGASKTTFEIEGLSDSQVDGTDATTVWEVEETGSGKSSEFTLDTEANNTMWGSAGSLRLTFHF